MKDYRYMGGMVAHYGKYDVYMIPEKDFDISQSQEDKQTIFGLTDINRDTIKLIHSGVWIGNASPQGKMELFNKSMFYGESLPAIIEEIDTDISASGIEENKIDPTEVFKPGESLTDRFIKGFNKWQAFGIERLGIRRG